MHYGSTTTLRVAVASGKLTTLQASQTRYMAKYTNYKNAACYFYIIVWITAWASVAVTNSTNMNDETYRVFPVLSIVGVGS